jgi:hypothetical protein
MAEIHHFMFYRINFTKERHCPSPSKMRQRERLVESLHNKRLDYDRYGFREKLKRVESKRRYYKRVRNDAPFASMLPKDINDYVDCLRAATKKCATVHQLSFECPKEKVSKSAKETNENSNF